MELTAAVQEKDYREVVYFNVFTKSRWFPWLLGGMGIISAVGLLMSFLFYQLPAALEMLFYAVLGIIVAMFVVTERMIRKFIRQDTNLIGTERTFSIDEERISLKDAFGEGCCYLWEELFRAYETEELFLFFLNEHQAMILPKRNQSQEDLEKLRSFLKRKLGSRWECRCKFIKNRAG